MKHFVMLHYHSGGSSLILYFHSSAFTVTVSSSVYLIHVLPSSVVLETVKEQNSFSFSKK